MPQVLRDTVAFLAVPNDDLVALLSPEFQAATLHEAELLSNEIVELEKTVVDSKASIEALWRDAKAAEFQLVSVFMHRGTSVPTARSELTRSRDGSERTLLHLPARFDAAGKVAQVQRQSHYRHRPYGGDL